jgi:WD40 repeat protein
LNSAIWTRLEEIIRRFEEEWKADRRPTIEDYLPHDPGERRATLVELVHLDLEYRWKAGEATSAESYLSRYPELADDSEVSLELTETVQNLQRRFTSVTPPIFPDHTPPACEGATGDGATPTVALGESPTVAGYEILRELGQGGMGIVYLARDQRLQRLVALKMLLPEGGVRASAVERFRREAEAIARLQHPNIVQIFQIGEQDGRPFLALEFVDGGNLAETLSGKAVPARQAARLVATLARAVHYAHQQDLVHRDLKPANILLQNEKPISQSPICNLQSAIPKISDFGLVKLLAGDSHQSQSGAVVGTPTYMAPEQALGKVAIVGPATDVYSLGVILYEMLTGRPPFQGESPTDTLLTIVTVDPVPPTRLQHKVPRDLETICLKCLHKDPRRRYTSAQALAEDLDRFLDGHPIQARPAGAVEKLWRWTKRNPLAAGLAAAVLLSLLAGTGISSAFAVQARARAEDALTEKRRADDKAREALAEQERADRQAEVARREERNAQDNARRAEQAQATAQEEKEKAQRLAAALAHDHGLNLCGQGQSDHGLLWLARSLELAPDSAPDLQRAIRTSLSAWRAHLHTLQLYLSHPDWVSSVAFSPDGKRILTGCRDGTARFWDAAAGEAVGKPLQHDGPVSAVAFNPDGKTVASSSGSAVRLWDSGTGQPVGQPLAHRLRVDRMTYSADGRSLLTATALSTFHLWDAATGKPMELSLEWENGQRPPPIRALAFTPDGHTIVAGIEASVRFWDVATGKFSQPPLLHPAGVGALAVSPDGKTLLTGSSDNLARFWDAATGKPLGQPLAHNGAVTGVAFSPDGKKALTCGNDWTARLWDVATGRPVGQSLPHTDLQAAAFSPDSKRVLTGGLDKVVRVWDIADGSDRGDILLNEVPSDVVLSPDGKNVLTWQHGKDTASLWETSTGKLLRETARHPVTLTAATFSSDGKTIATASHRGLQFEDAATGQPLPALIRYQGLATKLAYSPDSKVLVTTILNGTTWRTHLWDTTTGHPLRQPIEHGDSARLAYIHSVAFSPDGKRLLLAFSNQTARMWDVATGQTLEPVLRHEGPVWAAAFSPDGKTVVTASADRTARLWDAATGKPVGQPLQHFSRVWTVAFSPDGRSLVTGSDDRCARLWDAATGKQVGPPLRHDGPVRTVAFNSKGSTLQTVSWDPTGGRRSASVRVWALPAPIEVKPSRIVSWSKTLTALGLDAEGVVHQLSREQWREARRELNEPGHPPRP